MKFPSFRSRAMALAGTFLLAVSPIQALTIEFRGTISAIEAPSSVFNVGDDVVLAYTLAEPLVNQWQGDYSDAVFLYNASDVFLSLGSMVDTYAPVVQPASYIGEYNFFGQYGPNFDASLGMSLVPRVQIGLYSTSHVVTSPDGVLLPGFAISDFDYAFGRFYDNAGGRAFWDITAYNVTDGPGTKVPDVDETLVLFAIALLSICVVAGFTEMPRLSRLRC